MSGQYKFFPPKNKSFWWIHIALKSDWSCLSRLTWEKSKELTNMKNIRVKSAVSDFIRAFSCIPCDASVRSDDSRACYGSCMRRLFVLETIINVHFKQTEAERLVSNRCPASTGTARWRVWTKQCSISGIDLHRFSFIIFGILWRTFYRDAWYNPGSQIPYHVLIVFTNIS